MGDTFREQLTLDIQLSEHAEVRATQRNLSQSEIEFIVEHGHQHRGAGAIFCQLRRDCMPGGLPGNHPYRRLVGTTVLLSSCGQTVVTIYRNTRAFRGDLRKRKYSRGRRSAGSIKSVPLH